MNSGRLKKTIIELYGNKNTAKWIGDTKNNLKLAGISTLHPKKGNF